MIFSDYLDTSLRGNIDHIHHSIQKYIYTLLIPPPTPLSLLSLISSLSLYLSFFGLVEGAPSPTNKRNPGR